MKLARGRGTRRHPRSGHTPVIAFVTVVAPVSVVAVLGIAVKQDRSVPLDHQHVRYDGTTLARATRPRMPTVPRGARLVRYAAADGADGQPGSRTRPWHTIEHAVSALEPGMTLVLGRGVYGSRGETIEIKRSGTDAAPITIIGQNRPKLLGAIVVSGNHVRVRGIVFDGPTGRVLDRAELGGEGNVIEIYGDGVEIASSEVRNSRGRAGIYLEDAENARIVGNYIHHNGNFDDPAEANLDHGIYFGSGSGVIAKNVIEDNYAFGVQLYPRPYDVLVTHNTIVGNGRSGVILAADSGNSVVVNNIIAHNHQNAVRTYELVGTGNVVENNLFFSDSDSEVSSTSGDGVALIGNVTANPRFVSTIDYRLRRGSPALAHATSTGTVHADFRGTPRPTRLSADLGAFERP